jgi:hypothetical protein
MLERTRGEVAGFLGREYRGGALLGGRESGNEEVRLRELFQGDDSGRRLGRGGETGGGGLLGARVA